MIDYFEVAKYPLLDLKNFLIGFVVGVFSIFLFPLFFVFGYTIQTIRETLKKTDNLPSWNNLKNWKKFLVHGISAFSIIMIYLAPAFLLSFASLHFVGTHPRVILQSEEPWEDPMIMGGGFSPISVSLIFFGSILFFAAIFILPMALILYSATENIKYAFKLDEILPKIKRMIIPYIKALVASIFVFFLSLLLLLIPGAGFLIGGILFYPLLFSARLFSEVFRDYDY